MNTRTGLVSRTLPVHLMQESFMRHPGKCNMAAAASWVRVSNLLQAEVFVTWI